MADIAIRSLKKRYGGNQILHGVDLEFASGTFVVILGPSGCGKSTLLRLIAGLETITEGDIAINGRVVNQLPPRDRDCAMVFQNYALYPHMSVADNIGYSLKVAGIAKPERQRRIAAVAETLSLGPFLNRKPSALSGGQRQRVAMGRAMIREPSVFLFDEPLSNLDAQLRVQLRAEIRRLHKRLGVTSIFVTHDQVEAMTLADTLVVMNAGRVEQVGTPSEIYGTPATRFVATFVGSPAMNFIDGVVDAAGTFRANAASWSGLDVRIGDISGDRRVAIGVRPETVDVLYRPEPGAIAATVDFVEELGSGRIVHVQAGDQTIAAAISHSAPEPGREVWLRLDRTKVHAFCAETGVRLPVIADSAMFQAAPMAEIAL